MGAFISDSQWVKLSHGIVTTAEYPHEKPYKQFETKNEKMSFKWSQTKEEIYYYYNMCGQSKLKH